MICSPYCSALIPSLRTCSLISAAVTIESLLLSMERMTAMLLGHKLEADPLETAVYHSDGDHPFHGSLMNQLIPYWHSSSTRAFLCTGMPPLGAMHSVPSVTLCSSANRDLPSKLGKTCWSLTKSGNDGLKGVSSPNSSLFQVRLNSSLPLVAVRSSPCTTHPRSTSLPPGSNWPSLYSPSSAPS